MSNLETRDFRGVVDTDQRTITGLAVPYGQEIAIANNTYERFAPGAIQTIEDVKLFWNHDEPIGKVVEGRETDAGFEITAYISETPRGEEVLTLLRDGVLNKFSVGFIPVENERDDNVVVRTLVDLKEVSVVPFPAYSGANISEVREEVEIDPIEEPLIEQESEPMSENIELDVRTALDEVAELRRVVEAGMTVATAPAADTKFRSQGEFAKALVAGDADAKELAVRAASTSADTVALPGFVGYIDNLIVNNRPTVSAFSRGALPAAGLTVEYAQVSSNTLAIGVQDPENEALSFGNISIDTTSASVKTYGGYTSFSRQTVERSTVNYLDTAFRALTIQYAKATNAALVADLAALTWTSQTFDADGGTAASLAEGIANGAAYIYEKTGLRPEFILADPDAYVTIVKVAGSDGRPVLLTDGAGFNNIGTANIPGLSGSVFGLPVIVDPALASGTVYMANSAAVQTLESAGSPVRLTSGDITTLTDDISVYGYMAVIKPFLDAIVKLDVTA
jgi:HK97 family phage prohead protease/HK97 family phage major capsid protein